MTTHTIIEGDVRDGLRSLPDNSVQMSVTSPPYYGLRDYGVDGQIGLEPSLKEYIGNMVDVAREVRRVLRPDGVFFLNLGDCYAGGGKGPTGKNGIGNQTSRQGFHDEHISIPAGLKAKDLMGVPWRVAFALQDDGWYLRADLIWAKPNCMPSSVKDRPTTSHEYIFLLTKKPRYFWDGEAIREPVSGGTHPHGKYRGDQPKTVSMGKGIRNNSSWRRATHADPARRKFKQQKLSARAAHPPGTTENNPHKKTRDYEDLPRDERRLATGKTGFFHEKDKKQDLTGNPTYTGFNDRCTDNNSFTDGLTRNARSVWVISPQPRPEAHFATFPDELARRCIKAGTSEKGCCPKCGAPYRRIIVCSGGTTGKSWTPHDDDLGVGAMCGAPTIGYSREFRGWEPTCKCDAGNPVPCTVLDPFMGSGTVAVIARDLGRNSVGCEINPEYIQIARRRLRADEQVPGGNVEYRFRKVPAAAEQENKQKQEREVR